jgi:pimeloyl-ACP methyl ester carboxylesterase
LASLRGGRPSAMARLVYAAIRDRLGAMSGRAPRWIPASGAAGEAALMTAPEAREYLDLVPAGFQFDQRVAARSVFSLMGYSPGRWAGRIGAPVLLQVATRDQTTPAPAAVAVAGRIARCELLTYPVGHFTPYLGETFERFVADQLDFLRRNVAA